MNDAEQLAWYRKVIAEEMGFDGPAGDGVNPLRSWLRDLKGLQRDVDQITLGMGRVIELEADLKVWRGKYSLLKGHSERQRQLLRKHNQMAQAYSRGRRDQAESQAIARERIALVRAQQQEDRSCVGCVIVIGLTCLLAGLGFGWGIWGT